MVSTGPIHVRIDALILEGFEAQHQSRVASALQSELTYLLHKYGIPPALLLSGELGFLRLPAVKLAPGAPPETAGRQAAQAIYRGWNQFQREGT